MNKGTKAIYVVAILGMVWAIVLKRNQARSGYFKTGTQLKDVPVQVVRDGKTVQLSDVLKGKPAALHIFSTSCGVCMREWPHLKILQSTFGDEMKLVPIGMDYLANLKRLERSRPLGTPVYRGGEEAIRELPVPHYPFTIFVDEKLRVIHDHGGVVGHKAFAKALKRWRTREIPQVP